MEPRAPVSAASQPDSAAHIRRATAADAAEIARLGAQFAKPVEVSELRARIAELQVLPAYYLAVAEYSAPSLCGWIQVERRLIVAEARERAEIMGLVVDAAARRRTNDSPAACGLLSWYPVDLQLFMALPETTGAPQ